MIGQVPGYTSVRFDRLMLEGYRLAGALFGRYVGTAHAVLANKYVDGQWHLAVPYQMPPLAWDRKTRLKDICAHVNMHLRSEYEWEPVR